jgi:hypothetical protein
MHKGPRIKASPAAYVQLLFLFVSFFGPEGTLLCFGEDGHLAIEFVEAHDGSGFGAQLAATENDACGPCKDVQFLSSPSYTEKASHTPQIIPLMAQSPVSASFLGENCPSKHIDPPECSHHKSLASLQSVVLLI